MANHVSTQIKIDCNVEAQSLIDRWKGLVDYSSPDVSKLYEVDSESVDYNWLIENVGTKWCHVDEIFDDTICLTSAWDYPHKFVEWVAEKIFEVDDSATIIVTYSDEMPNFAGYRIITSVGDRENSIDWDTIVDMTTEENPTLKNLDEDSDEYFEELHEHVWQVIYAWQDREIGR